MNEKIKNIETPEYKEEFLSCIGARRLVKGEGYDRDHYMYLICNGTSMGKEKRSFDVTCIADTYDTKCYTRNRCSEGGYEVFDITIVAKFKKEYEPHSGKAIEALQKPFVPMTEKFSTIYLRKKDEEK